MKRSRTPEDQRILEDLEDLEDPRRTPALATSMLKCCLSSMAGP
jgi:hypothetical protein